MSNLLYVGAFDAPYAPLHKSGMHDHNIPALLRAMMAAIPCKQTELAARLTKAQKRAPAITQPQISRWLSGQEPERANYDRIVAMAKTLGLLDDIRSEDVASAMPEPEPPKKVKIKGYVGASAEAVYYRVADEDLGEATAPPRSTEKTVAVEIRGKSLGPALEDWIVYYDDIRSPVTEDLIGHLCVVGLADDRVLVKKIMRGRNGTYTLLSNERDEEPISDIEIEWAARVTAMLPRS